MEPPPSDSGKPDWFDRLPVKNGQIEILKKCQFNWFQLGNWPV